jgi:hypothetical protein
VPMNRYAAKIFKKPLPEQSLPQHAVPKSFDCREQPQN